MSDSLTGLVIRTQNSIDMSTPLYTCTVCAVYPAAVRLDEDVGYRSLQRDRAEGALADEVTHRRVGDVRRAHGDNAGQPRISQLSLSSGDLVEHRRRARAAGVLQARWHSIHPTIQTRRAVLELPDERLCAGEVAQLLG